MNITEIAKRIAEKHYPNLPTAPCDNVYRDGRMKELEKLVESELKNLRLGGVSGRSFDWDKFAKALDDKFGESLISADDADENNPYDYWLQDVTVADIVEFCKNYR